MGKSMSTGYLCGTNSLTRRPKFLQSKRRMTWSPRPHLEIKQWLSLLDLSQYVEAFSKFGGVEDMLHLTEREVRDLGVKVGSHRAQIVSSLVILREKYQRGNKGRSSGIGGSTSRLAPANSSENKSSVAKNNSSLNTDRSSGPGSSCNGGAGISTGQSTGMEPLVDPAASPQQLRSALEWELSLDGRDLRSHAWYHGTIPRHRAEELMAEDGDFLIRDCISQPGDYVLTCRWRAVCLHFVINKVVIQPNTVYERIQFQFEDDSYDTVPDLVTYYVGSGKQISVASSARILRPVTRSMPLTFYATKYGSQCLAAYGMLGGVGGSPSPSVVTDPSPRPSPFQSQHNTPGCSPPTPRREIPPRLPDKHGPRSAEIRRFGMVLESHGQSEEHGQYRTNQPMSSGDSPCAVTSSVPGYSISSHSRQQQLVRVGSEPSLSPPLDRRRAWDGQMASSAHQHHTNTAPSAGRIRHQNKMTALSISLTRSLDAGDDPPDGEKPPPKPSRVPSMRIQRRPVPQLPIKPSMDASGGSLYYNSLSGGEEHKYEDPELVQAPRIVAAKDGSNNEYQNGGSGSGGGGGGGGGSDSGNGSGDSVHSGDTSGSCGEPNVGNNASLKRRTNPLTAGSGCGVGGGALGKKRPGSRPVSESRLSTFLEQQQQPHLGLLGNGPMIHGRADGGGGGGSGSVEGDSAAEDEVMLLSIPELNHPSRFDLENFSTLVLQHENKPLDAPALNLVKSALLETGPRVLANHLTRMDVDVLRSDTEHDLGLGVASGIELITLPQGHQHRLDLIERLECLKLFVAITILTTMNETERTDLLNKWILMAIDVKTALGNLFGFTGIMLALGLPQIQRLKTTWFSLRQVHTENAFTYETKLRPTLKAMNEGTNPQAPNTSIPHLLPLLALLERPLDNIANESFDCNGSGGDGNANLSVTAIGISNSPASAAFLWETSTSDYGIQLIQSHLEAGRSFVAQCAGYKRNAEIVLDSVKYDDLLLDMFRTEFHLRFLWGYKGAMVNSTERHAKFQQVLYVMSERCEASI